MGPVGYDLGIINAALSVFLRRTCVTGMRSNQGPEAIRSMYGLGVVGLATLPSRFDTL